MFIVFYIYEHSMDIEPNGIANLVLFLKKTNGPILPLRLQQKIGDLLERGRKKFEPHVGIK